MRVVSGGVVCLQDHDPTALGNPLCIMGEREEEIIACAKRFLKEVGYRGFANFDIKLDERDGAFRFFEVNTRCGRNTYYLSLGGVNFVELIVREFLLGEAIRLPRGVRPVRLQLRAALRARSQHGEPRPPAAGPRDAAPHAPSPIRCTTRLTRSSTTSGRRPCT